MSEEKTFTQEEFNDKLGEVLAKKTKKYEDEIAKKQSEIDGLNQQIKELKNSYANFDDEKAKSTEEIGKLKAKIKEYETDSAKRKIADEIGLDAKAVEFITGETDEEMKASAEKLKALTGATPPPLAKTEKESVSNIDAAFMELNDKIKGN